MLKWIVIGCISLCVNVMAQTQVTGRVIDADTGDPIDYVNVFVRSQKVGTLTDSLGVFQLLLHSSSNISDTISFSRIGYIGKVMSIQSFGASVVLQKKPESNTPIIVIGSHPRDTIVGLAETKLEVSKIHGYLNSFDLRNRKWMNNQAFELALRIDIPSSVTDTKIRTLGVYLPSIGSPKAPFRVKLYRIDPITDLPGDFLKEVNLVYRSNKKDDWYEIDLEGHNIHAESPGFYVSMEWLGTDKRKYWSKRDLAKNKFISEETKRRGKLTLFGQVLGMYVNTQCIIARRDNFRDWNQGAAYRHPMIRATLSIAN